MKTIFISVLTVVGIIVVIVVVNLFRFTLNDFMEKTLKKTLWLWLPFHALKRLSREFGEKYLK